MIFHSLTVPVDLWCASMSSHKLVPMQDPPHVGKKLRNQAALLDTHVLILTDDDCHLNLDEVVVRWDLVLKLALKDPKFLMACGKSAVNLTDKQDPSLVADLACLYQYFLDHKMFAMGIYLKAVYLLLEAFYHPSLTPSERMCRAWYTKSFFVLWHKNSKNAQGFISDKSFKDLKCCVDGLLNYLLLMRKMFPDCPIIPGKCESKVTTGSMSPTN